LPINLSQPLIRYPKNNNNADNKEKRGKDGCRVEGTEANDVINIKQRKNKANNNESQVNIQKNV